MLSESQSTRMYFDLTFLLSGYRETRLQNIVKLQYDTDTGQVG